MSIPPLIPQGRTNNDNCTCNSCKKRRAKEASKSELRKMWDSMDNMNGALGVAMGISMTVILGVIVWLYLSK